MVEVLLGGQDKKDFIRFKKTVTKGLVASDSTATIVFPRGSIEDSFKLMLDKFENQAFKDFAARHQINYLGQNLRKPMGVTTTRACAGSMSEVIEYMEKLDFLEATHKQSSTKKNDKDKSEDETGNSNNKTKKIHKKNSKSKGKKRKRNYSEDEDDQFDKYYAIYRAKGGPV